MSRTGTVPSHIRFSHLSDTRLAYHIALLERDVARCRSHPPSPGTGMASACAAMEAGLVALRAEQDRRRGRTTGPPGGFRF
jgi:hypothetical protein